MKRLLLVLILALSAPIFTGCQSGAYTVAPGADPLVVHSERALKSAFTLVDEFLKWEHQNRAVAGKEVSRIATQLRIDFPQADAAAWSALAAYKGNRTAANKAELNTWLALVLDLKTTAMSYYGAKTTQNLNGGSPFIWDTAVRGQLATNYPVFITR